MPLPWVMIFFFLFFFLYSVSLFLGSFSFSSLVSVKSVKLNSSLLPW